MTKESREKIYTASLAVIEGEVISHNIVYLYEGQELTKLQLNNLTKIKPKIKTKDDDLTVDFSEPKSSSILVKHIVSIKVRTNSKGQLEMKNITCSWTDPYLSLCSHVGITAEVGESIACYIVDKPREDGIYDSNSFYIGNSLNIETENKLQ